ncbi:LOW QUALITY PROTEIN: hypothetical protein MXB_3590 [Myxobolus squamalis]|nr:LOW QUALITY PROTEIN: hypothetical protein MXB_3590 [Myxobolus squamalis]
MLTARGKNNSLLAVISSSYYTQYDSWLSNSFKFDFLPPYSPELNPIDELFKEQIDQQKTTTRQFKHSQAVRCRSDNRNNHR